MSKKQVVAGFAAALVVGGFSANAMAQSAQSNSGGAELAGGHAEITPPPGFRDSCVRFDWLCSSLAESPTPFEGDRLLALAEDVNRRVNLTVTQLSDPENYGVAEYWTLPTNGRGDCEDFVLQKFKDLLDAGVPVRDLSVAIVLDRRGNNHAVLVVHHARGDLILDSLTSQVLPWNRSGYRFLAMQSAQDKARWEIVADTSPESAHLAMR